MLGKVSVILAVVSTEWVGKTVTYIPVFVRITGFTAAIVRVVNEPALGVNVTPEATKATKSLLLLLIYT